LFRLKATGTPCELASKLGISKRQVYRYIDDMKEMGLKIEYCKKRKTYHYQEETFLKFKMVALENGVERKIIGGENNFNFLELFLQSAKKWHSTYSSL
jgi:DNA-binding transcriptional regulator GbsR (MarR family)